MGKALDEAFIFYASYHNNPVNQWIHILCIWPIAITALIFLQYTNALPVVGGECVDLM